MIINMFFETLIQAEFSAIFWVQLNLERKFAENSQLKICIFNRFTLVNHQLYFLSSYFVYEILEKNFETPLTL